jgi:hypothetical protein
MRLRLFLIGLVTVVFAACTSPNGGQTTVVTPDRVQKVTRLAAYTAVKLQLRKDATSRTTLTKISSGLNDLVTEQQWDIASVVTIANANGLNELTSDEAQIVLTAAPAFLDLFLNQQVDLRQVEYAEAFVTGAAEGFKLGLGGSAPAASTRGPDTTLDRLIKEARATR